MQDSYLHNFCITPAQYENVCPRGLRRGAARNFGAGVLFSVARQLRIIHQLRMREDETRPGQDGDTATRKLKQ